MARGLRFCFVPAAWLFPEENGLSFDVDVRSVLGPVFDDATGPFGCLADDEFI